MSQLEYSVVFHFEITVFCSQLKVEELVFESVFLRFNFKLSYQVMSRKKLPHLIVGNSSIFYFSAPKMKKNDFQIMFNVPTAKSSYNFRTNEFRVFLVFFVVPNSSSTFFIVH